MITKNSLIFLVDDNIQFNRFVELGLLKHGFKNVKSFISGENCIENLDFEPHIVILDYNLDTPGGKIKTGLQLTGAIKTILPNTFIIMLSGEMHKDPARFTDTRFLINIDKYLLKGMDNIKELVETINGFDSIYYR